MRTRFVLSLVLLLLCGGASACAQDTFVNARDLTPQRCRIDYELWRRQFDRDPDMLLLSVRQLAVRGDEMATCMSIDKKNAARYYDFEIGADSFISARIWNFFREHPTMRNAFLDADAKGKNREMSPE
jgi:hypothetical protein